MKPGEGVARRRAVYLCPQIGTPDHDRCNALAASGFEVFAVEWPSPKVYRWDLPGEADYAARVFAGRGRWSGLWALLILLGLLLRLRPQLGIVYAYQYPSFFLAAVALRCLGAAVISLNDSRFDDHPRSWWRDAMKRLMLMPYTSFLAATLPARDYLWYFGCRRVELYHCAIDVGRIARDSWQSFAETAFEERYFLTIGRFETEKNQLLLLDGFEAYARDTASPRPLLICGYGSLEGALRARVAASPILRPLVRIVGYVPSREMPNLLGRAIALLLPSRLEVFGIVAIEAMAAGVPPVVAAGCGVAELVQNGVNGLLVDPLSPTSLAWAMRAIVADEAGWDRMSATAREVAPIADVGVFVDLIERALRQRRARRSGWLVPTWIRGR